MASDHQLNSGKPSEDPSVSTLTFRPLASISSPHTSKKNLIFHQTKVLTLQSPMTWSVPSYLKLTTDISDIMRSITISEQRSRRLVRKLRLSCSPGVDGVLAEHLRYGAPGTYLMLCPSTLLTLCVRYCCVPENFSTGILSPILKKPQLDPSSPSSIP